MFSTTPWFLSGNFSKDSVSVIKTQNHTTRQNSCSYVIIRELQARKHNQFSAIKRLLRKTRFRDEHFMISNSRYQSFLETKISFKTLNLWKQHKGHEISKNCQERGDRSLISHPSLLKIRENALKLELFNRFLHLIFETNISFQNSNTQTSFLKSSNHDRTRKLRKLTSQKVYTCNKALKHLPQILFCLPTTPYSHGNVVVQKKGY